MKKTLIALTVFLASYAHAANITVKELNELYQKNAEAFRRVTVGMSAKYIDYEVNLGSWCEKDREEIVTEVVPQSKYRVRITKTTRNYQCGDLPEGAIEETYEWRKLKDLEIEEEEYGNIELEGNLVSIFKFKIYPNRNTSILRKKLDVTKSQFYNCHRYNSYQSEEAEYSEYTSDLIFRDGKPAYSY